MKPSLQLKISQQLTMTPQLQQAIRLLQLSTLDLSAEIQAAIESNPMLEREDDADTSDEFDDLEESWESDAEALAADDYDSATPDPSGADGFDDPDDRFEASDFSADGYEGALNGAAETNGDHTTDGAAEPDARFEAEAFDAGERQRDAATESKTDSVELSGVDDLGEDRGQLEDQWKDDIPDELAVDTSWDDLVSSAPTQSANPDDDTNLDAMNAAPESLSDHLHWQLNLTRLSPTDLRIGTAIIDSIDSRGYLRETVEGIVECLEDPEIEPDDVTAVLRLIQNFDPVGVGARDLGECLYVQLRQLDPSTPFRDLAARVVTDCLELLGRRDYRTIMGRMKIDEPTLDGALTLIRTLDPAPGESIEPGASDYVIPDVLVRPNGNGWTVELNGEALPRVRINPFYESAARNCSSGDRVYFSSNLQEARWFLKSLQSRNETLLKVASSIVERQQKFFRYGPTGMVPMVLHDIAEAVGMHESTISRVTSRKYMHTPHGVYELKYFFSSHVGTVSGDGEVSSTAIRARIREIVEQEDARKPLSDSKIATILAEQDNIKVARRTIAKYRESLGILPSSQRKRLH